MASNCRSFEFTAAIRGFHIYQKVWQPELNDTLVCIHEREWIWCFQCKDRSCWWLCYCWTFTKKNLPPNEVFTWQRSDSKSYNYMFALPSLSTFSRWPRDTMYGYSEYARNNSKSFVIRPVQTTCHWPIFWAWRWSYHREFSIANWTSSNWEATKMKENRFSTRKGKNSEQRHQAFV